jgi:RNA ligase
MNFLEYIGKTEEEFVRDYLVTGLVSESLHKEFPLNMYTYSRKTVHDNVWDGVTSKCRGIIIHRETNEIIARPFEKFHNYASTCVSQTKPEDFGFAIETQPCIFEKLDGFMLTGYRWGGEEFLASKGSFHSIHAKWATAEWKKQSHPGFPTGWTPVFEGICRDLRIVIDYGTRSELVLLALINNETGEEKPPTELAHYAAMNGLRTPKLTDGKHFDYLVRATAKEDAMDGEGYVLTWFNPGAPPTRLKLKYIEYLRLHRMVTGVSPKRIWEVLSQAEFKGLLQEYLDNSTPWFSKFVTKWVTALRGEYETIQTEVAWLYGEASVAVDKQRPFPNLGAERKAWAQEFTKTPWVSAALFAMLDGKSLEKSVWNYVKRMTQGGTPLVDAHA